MKNMITATLIITIALTFTIAACANEKDYSDLLWSLNSQKETKLQSIDYYQQQLEYLSTSVYQAESYGDTNSLQELKEQVKSLKEILASLKKDVSQIQADINYYKNI